VVERVGDIEVMQWRGVRVTGAELDEAKMESSLPRS
jgi:hypothetical protein